ncbi:hypothetical protein LJB99_04915 [Deltaproteobacteria bacterium OttesenSCG-928-K17]|nr:hypothetical protein [Deltaproteobacteria bacterium OttesenSCG-928-K17]
MKKGDLAAALIVLAGAVLLLVLPESHFQARAWARDHRYAAGLLVFLLLGPPADYLRARLSGLDFSARPRLYLGWALVGLALAAVMWLFNGGVSFAQASGLLPGGGYGHHSFLGRGAAVFFTSVFFLGPLFSAVMLVFIFLPAAGFWFRLTRTRDDSGRKNHLKHYFYLWPARNQAGVFEAGPVLIRLALFTLIFMFPQDLWLIMTAWLGSVVAVIEGYSMRLSARKPAKAPGPDSSN